MKTIRRGAGVCMLVLTATLTGFAADYHWTGAAGDHKWSTPGNWETKDGDAVTSVETSKAHSYNFGTRKGVNVGWEDGLVVTQDVNVAVSSFALNPKNDDTTERTLTWVSAPGKKFSKSGEGICYIQRNSRLRLEVDLTGKDEGNFVIQGGEDNSAFHPQLIFALKGCDAYQRTLQIQKRLNVVYDGGAVPRYRFQLDNMASASGGFEVKSGAPELISLHTGNSTNLKVGQVRLDGNTATLGVNYSNTSSTNWLVVPVFSEGGTLKVAHERHVALQGLPIGGGTLEA